MELFAFSVDKQIKKKFNPEENCWKKIIENVCE